MQNKELSLYFSFAAMLSVAPGFVAGAEELPADTYFSIAVSDNSHNHYGDNLLFLDFQDSVESISRNGLTVISPRVAAGSITIDGQAKDWDPALLTQIRSRVMNNYPLSEHYDATPTDITVGSAFDDEYIYFIVQYEDANKDASVNRNRWVYDGGNWLQQGHVKPAPGTAAERAVNRMDQLAGREDEDQIFLMFPIVDQQANFVSGSLGCAGYCHANLAMSPDPTKAQIGDGVASMHTTLPGDLADLWHWTATRSRPMNTLKDGYLDYGDQSYNGRKVDDGTAPFEDNAGMAPFRPLYVDRSDYEAGRYDTAGYSTALLNKADLLPITPDMEFAQGVSVPFYIGVPATGSRADVVTSASFDQVTGVWTVEFRRKLVTEDRFDRQFVAGDAALAPQQVVIMPGDSTRGEQLYRDKACASCHGERGGGTFKDGIWLHPRNQRASGPSIQKTAHPFRPKRLHSLAFELKRYEEEPPKALMPYVPLTPQEAEDIAVWLQQQFIPRGK